MAPGQAFLAIAGIAAFAALLGALRRSSSLFTISWGLSLAMWGAGLVYRGGPPALLESALMGIGLLVLVDCTHLGLAIPPGTPAREFAGAAARLLTRAAPAAVVSALFALGFSALGPKVGLSAWALFWMMVTCAAAVGLSLLWFTGIMLFGGNGRG
jgi:hypothetical protein